MGSADALEEGTGSGDSWLFDGAWNVLKKIELFSLKSDIQPGPQSNEGLSDDKPSENGAQIVLWKRSVHRSMNSNNDQRGED